jgi:hypothetical protein
MDLQKNSNPNLQIPQIVPFLTNTVRETNGQRSEGIFRVPGDADAVTDLVIYFVTVITITCYLSTIQ